MPRVVSCSVCHVLERMTDPPAGSPMVPAKWEWELNGTIHEHVFTTDDGEVIMVPEYDPLLSDFVERHSHGRVDTDSIDYIRAFSVDQSTWDRVDVVSQVKAELSEATGEQFAESEYYKEEALKCYNAHGNPDLKRRCIDVFSDDKKIGRTEGVPDRDAIYLCHMCPYVQAHVMESLRARAKLYDPKAVRATMSKLQQRERILKRRRAGR